VERQILYTRGVEPLGRSKNTLTLLLFQLSHLSTHRQPTENRLGLVARTASYVKAEPTGRSLLRYFIVSSIRHASHTSQHPLESQSFTAYYGCNDSLGAADVKGHLVCTARNRWLGVLEAGNAKLIRSVAFMLPRSGRIVQVDFSMRGPVFELVRFGTYRPSESVK
jgi:hypothetical protein